MKNAQAGEAAQALKPPPGLKRLSSNTFLHNHTSKYLSQISTCACEKERGGGGQEYIILI